jgi:hypothetical protein
MQLLFHSFALQSFSYKIKYFPLKNSRTLCRYRKENGRCHIYGLHVYVQAMYPKMHEFSRVCDLD